MATAENTIAIDDIKNELANSVKLENMTDSERTEVYNMLYATGEEPILNVNSIFAKANDVVHGEDIAGINGGKYWIGKQTQVNPTTEAHISHFIHKAL